MRAWIRSHTMRWGWVVVALVLSTAAMAQSKFVINGRLKVDGGGLDGCRMVVYKDGVKDRTISADLNRFSLELDLGASYILSFEKAGFVTKKLLFNTQVPALAMQGSLTPFQFVVSLFKQYEGMNTVVFNQPVGMIRFNQALGDFDYDTDYTKSIQSALEAAQAEVEHKQKEEARAEADAAKQQQQAAKDQAKQQAAVEKAKAEQAKLAKQEVKPKPQPQPSVPPAPAPAEQVAATHTKPKAEPPPRPPVAKPAPARSMAPAMQASDSRRPTASRTLEEPSKVQAATAHTLHEPRPKFEASPSLAVRHQDVIVQPNEVVTVIKVEKDDVVTEYRRVARKFSGVFYFKNGSSCSRQTYESEALAEN